MLNYVLLSRTIPVELPTPADHQGSAQCWTFRSATNVPTAVGVPAAYHGLSAMTLPKNNANSVLLQRNQYFLPKPTAKTASAPELHLRFALACPPYPLSTYPPGREGSNEGAIGLTHRSCFRVAAALTLATRGATIRRIRIILDNLLFLKARRQGIREDVKWHGVHLLWEQETQTTINVLGIVSEGGHDDDMSTDRRDHVMPGRMGGELESQGKRGGWEGESRDCWRGAIQCGAQSNVFNPTLRLFSHTCLHISRTRLHKTSDDNQTRRHKKHKQKTNTTTMVVELLAPLAAWI